MTPSTHDCAGLSANYGNQIVYGDVVEALKCYSPGLFRCCVTSPRYRYSHNYVAKNGISTKDNVEDYIGNLVSIFREVRRVLTPDGSLWLRVGDSYKSGNYKWGNTERKFDTENTGYRPPSSDIIKPNDLIGIPWRLAFALQADGWYLRSDIIWYKADCPSELIKDRPVRCHDYLFLLTKSKKYFYNYEAVAEATVNSNVEKNRRTVWNFDVKPTKKEGHDNAAINSIELCILAGSKEGDFIIDPFYVSNTAKICRKLGRGFVGIKQYSPRLATNEK